MRAALLKFTNRCLQAGPVSQTPAPMSPLWRSLHLKQLLKFLKSGIFHKIIWILSKVGRPDDLFLMVQTAGVGTGNPCRQVSMLQCAQTPALPVTLLTPKPQASHHLPSHLPYSFVHTQMRHLFMSSSCPCRHFYIQVSDCQAKLIGWESFLVIPGAWGELRILRGLSAL